MVAEVGIRSWVIVSKNNGTAKIMYAPMHDVNGRAGVRGGRPFDRSFNQNAPKGDERKVSQSKEIKPYTHTNKFRPYGITRLCRKYMSQHNVAADVIQLKGGHAVSK